MKFREFAPDQRLEHIRFSLIEQTQSAQILRSIGTKRNFLSEQERKLLFEEHAPNAPIAVQERMNELKLMMEVYDLIDPAIRWGHSEFGEVRIPVLEEPAEIGRDRLRSNCGDSILCLGDVDYTG